MKKRQLFLLLFITTGISFAQVTFEKGYYIDNENQKTACFIKNIDWKSNPTEFEYKSSKNSKTFKGTLKFVQEFGIYNTSKYIRNNVDIDRSSENINKLSTSRNPIFNQEVLFLKIIVAGSSNLYEYIDGNLERYFYSGKNENIQQLIYKSYKTVDNDIRENNRFRQQLAVHLNCIKLNMSEIKRINYTKNDLADFFITYSKCNQENFIDFQPKQKRDLFNLSIRPRLNRSSLTVKSDAFNTPQTTFKPKNIVGLGLEMEFILPFNKNKWAIVFEPTYQSFKAEKRIDANNVSGGVLITAVDYSSIEIPISLRHYFFLNENSKIFVNTSFIFDLDLKSSINYNRGDGSNLYSLVTKTRNNIGLGIGYKQNDKYSLEIRYHASREISRNGGSPYQTTSIIFGYSVF
jgi:hypothetical protein